jgi:hypothetical protein
LYIPECADDAENEENAYGMARERAFSAENINSAI